MSDENTIVIQPPKSNLEYMAIQNNAAMASIGYEEKSKVISYALGLAIGRKLSVPTAPVESLYNYYKDSNEGNVKEAICAFNEKIVINTEAAREMANKVWSVRYCALHGMGAIPSFHPYNFFEIIIGTGNYVDEKLNAFVNEYKVAIIEVSNSITELLNKQ